MNPPEHRPGPPGARSAADPRTAPAAAPAGSPSPPVLPPVTTAAEARDRARAVVREQWESPSRTAREQDVIDLLLVVSELVTNAIRHGDGLAGFEAWAVEEGVRLRVHDHSDVLPEAAFGPGDLPTTHGGNGYGWPLVIRLAREIALDRRDGGGKTVSVLVPLRPAAPGAASGAL